MPRFFASDPASLVRYELILDIVLCLVATFSLLRVFGILYEQEQDAEGGGKRLFGDRRKFFPALVKGFSAAGVKGASVAWQALGCLRGGQ